MSMDGWDCRRTDRQLDGATTSECGWEAKQSFWRVLGPLDHGKRGLGNVELCRCSLRGSKTCLGAARRS